MPLPNRTIDDVTSELHVALRRGTTDILTIGGLLSEAKEKIPHGEWLPWLKNEFSMSERSAQNYMKAANFAAKYETDADLNISPSALFLISRYDQPEIANAVINAAKEKLLGRDQAKEIVDKKLAELNVRPAKRRSGITQRDQVEFEFTARVTQLTKLTESYQVDRFTKCPVKADVLARLGRFLMDAAAQQAEKEILETSDDRAT